MQGKVKWFSEEKGYGYIVAEDGTELYFNIRDIKGTDLPRNRDSVSFESKQGKSGPKACLVSIISRDQGSSSKHSHDERVACQHCGKKMVPRVITYRGEPQKSICPYCAGIHKDFGYCFIATAVYGDYHAPEVIALCRFRDEALEPMVLGRLLISSYYKISPPIANYLRHKPVLAEAFKRCLNIIVKRYN